MESAKFPDTLSSRTKKDFNIVASREQFKYEESGPIAREKRLLPEKIDLPIYELPR